MNQICDWGGCPMTAEFAYKNRSFCRHHALFYWDKEFRDSIIEAYRSTLDHTNERSGSAKSHEEWYTSYVLGIPEHNDSDRSIGETSCRKKTD